MEHLESDAERSDYYEHVVMQYALHYGELPDYPLDPGHHIRLAIRHIQLIPPPDDYSQNVLGGAASLLLPLLDHWENASKQQFRWITRSPGLDAADG